MSSCRATNAKACRVRQPLHGSDAQALEHALTITERERDEAKSALVEVTHQLKLRLYDSERERDEARAELDAMTRKSDEYYRERDEARAEVERLRTERDEARGAADKLGADAFRLAKEVERLRLVAACHNAPPAEIVPPKPEAVTEVVTVTITREEPECDLDDAIRGTHELVARTRREAFEAAAKECEHERQEWAGFVDDERPMQAAEFCARRIRKLGGGG